ncbi:hypothetical protein ABFS82_03G029200 [Erythranthe guttata]|uniref:Transcription factor RAX3 n=1 Tax=Erythranthe guttata TaxID=4155 RepID=A0A022R5U4_ERYGU|nr:PREDICTED: transcription factor RAX2-like [Erythranthe guttata]EYU34205.1 hypothetical protein MIMGU_mgv1a018634mg [Erythranthe guttata]|eukprot:XP_012841193.1 PREDICTED: transcription factor RAX2-like [Erythranthe guttata]
MGRAPCCDKANVKKGPWSPEEDSKLKSYIDKHGTGGNWISLPLKIGLKRCGKSCRLRWLNYLRPNLKHGGFSEDEDNIICSLYISIGSRWSIIAAQLPGRTDNDIKNYWNTRLKKKLLGKQRKDKLHDARRRSTARGGKHNYHSGQTPVAAYEPPPPAAQLPPHDVLLPPIPYSDQEPRFNNEHSNIRKLLVKLGGRFSNGSNQNNVIDDGEELKFHYYPAIDESLLIPPVNYDYSIPNSSSQIPLLDSTCQDVPCLPNNEPLFDMSTLLNGPGFSLPAEIERVVYENQDKLQGLEFFYDDIVNGTNYTTASMEWGEMNSLVFGAATSNSFGIDQKTTRYPGTQ